MRRAAALSWVCGVAGCFADLDAWPVATSAADLDALTLDAGAFGASGDDDRDGDCMRDDAEHAVARWFRPIFLFDTRENARRLGEPAVLYQAHPIDGRGRCDVAPTRVEVTYAYLFVDDGGYATSTFCADRHPGDDQYLRVVLDVSPDGRRFAVRSVWNWGVQFPAAPMRVLDREHPLIYLSAGKHHPYFDSRADGRPSLYSSWSCVDGVNGRGAMNVPTLESPSAPQGRLNVGEPTLHPADAFVGDLGALGFAGESAWGADAFCGSRPRSGCEGNNPLRAIWD